MGKGEAKGAVKDSNGDDFYNEKSNDNNNFTFAVVSFVSNESRFACTTVGAHTVVTNSIYMTTMQAFLTFVDIYG